MKKTLISLSIVTLCMAAFTAQAGQAFSVQKQLSWTTANPWQLTVGDFVPGSKVSNAQSVVANDVLGTFTVSANNAVQGTAGVDVYIGDTAGSASDIVFTNATANDSISTGLSIGGGICYASDYNGVVMPKCHLNVTQGSVPSGTISVFSWQDHLLKAGTYTQMVNVTAVVL